MGQLGRQCAALGVGLGVVLLGVLARAAVLDRPVPSRETTLLSLALLTLGLGAALARRHRRQASDYEDRERWAPATVSAERVVLDDDEMPWIVVDGAPRPGRALVRRRVGQAVAASYRAVRELRCAEVLAIDPAAVRGVAELRATEALRVAAWLAIGLATCAGVEATSEWVVTTHALFLR